MDTVMRKAISAKDRLLVTLRFLASGKCSHSIGYYGNCNDIWYVFSSHKHKKNGMTQRMCLRRCETFLTV
ncbi:hypothetical protein PR048_008283 [Dryococelus australis]|uniref:Uncharacterized protein n=1 Tax=Dryococelus australis TaxID=614101 RepID=A0ABQ9HWP0_9NEOP|nr:hypothetical protein PR048_008283 [Dryococelus australis]